MAQDKSVFRVLKRLYPTVKELRETRELEDKYGLRDRKVHVRNS